jgi:hypothetical protein
VAQPKNVQARAAFLQVLDATANLLQDGALSTSAVLRKEFFSRIFNTVAHTVLNKELLKELKTRFLSEYIKHQLVAANSENNN